jgi:uncharacterized damage-inducible protein DinB
MTLQEIRDSFAYNRWAHERLLDVLDGLADEQLTAAIPSSFPSLLATLAHMVAAEWVWLRRWRGESPRSFPEWLQSPSLADLRARLDEVETERRAFIDSLTEADLDAVLAYTTLDGTPLRSRLADLFLHVVNHASYHRGQLVTMLRQLGAPVASTDFVLYKRQVVAPPATA